MGRSGIRDDPWKYYYCGVEKFLNIYSMQLGLGGAYGHNSVNIFMDEFVWWY